MPNYAQKFSPKVDERFYHESYTKGAASNAYDFEGVRIVKIYSEDTFAFTNYTRSGMAFFSFSTAMTVVLLFM